MIRVLFCSWNDMCSNSTYHILCILIFSHFYWIFLVLPLTGVLFRIWRHKIIGSFKIIIFCGVVWNGQEVKIAGLFKFKLMDTSFYNFHLIVSHARICSSNKSYINNVCLIKEKHFDIHIIVLNMFVIQCYK